MKRVSTSITAVRKFISPTINKKTDAYYKLINLQDCNQALVILAFPIMTFFIAYFYPSFTGRRIVLQSFGRDVRTRLQVAISEMSGPLVFHIRVGAFREVLCPRTQHANLPACSPQHSLNGNHQAKNLWISIFKSFLL